jgi:hypothetical protein
MPDGAARVSVVGDSEFVAVALIEQLEEWSFYYVLRQKSSHLVCCERCSEPHRPRREWRALGELIEPRGERVWLEGAFLSRLDAHRTNLVLYWKRGEKEPWLLATNLPECAKALSCYRRRMWIEQMFADFQGARIRPGKHPTT